MTNQFTSLDNFIVRVPMFSFAKAITGLSNRTEFLNIVQSPLFKEAILYASPSLFKELKKFLSNDLSEKERLKMEKTLTKYLIRMGFRSTPFGLFSLCGSGYYGDKTFIAKPESFRIERNLDFEFKNIIYSDNLKKLCFVYNINFIANQTIRESHSSMIFQGRNANGNHRKYILYPSDIIKDIIRFFCVPKSFSDGYTYICKEYDICKDDYYNLIQNLSGTLILIPEFVSDLLPDQPHKNNYENLIDTYLSDYKRILISKDNMTENNIESVYEMLSQLNINKRVNIKNILKVNTYLTNNTIIYNGIKTRLQEVLRLFTTLTPNRSSRLSTFIRKFRERYESEAIPLLEALDPNIGIGYGNDLPGGKHSLLQELKTMKTHNRQPQHKSIVFSPYEQIIVRKLNLHSSIEMDTILLNDNDFPNKSNYETLSYPSIGCMYKYIGKQNGVDVISDIQFMGPSACKMISRFSSECSEFNSLCENICRHENAINENAIYCEISHLPKDHMGNILSRPCWRDAICYYMTFPQYSSRDIVEIKLTDLYIKLENGKLIIWSKTLEKQIIPRITSAYNYYYDTTPLYQFLGDMQNGGVNENMSLSIKNLLQIKHYIPRVQYKNIILSKRSLFISNEELVESYKSDIHEYLESLKMPRFISYTEGDNQLVFDLRSELCLNLFIEIFKSKRDIMVEEYLPLSEEFKSIGYNVEIISPLIKAL